MWWWLEAPCSSEPSPSKRMNKSIIWLWDGWYITSCVQAKEECMTCEAMSMDYEEPESERCASSKGGTSWYVYSTRYPTRSQALSWEGRSKMTHKRLIYDEVSYSEYYYECFILIGRPIAMTIMWRVRSLQCIKGVRNILDAVPSMELTKGVIGREMKLSRSCHTPWKDRQGTMCHDY